MLSSALCLYVKCDTCYLYGNETDWIWFEYASMRPHAWFYLDLYKSGYLRLLVSDCSEILMACVYQSYKITPSSPSD